MTEDGERYIEAVKMSMANFTDKEKIEFLTNKVAYWYEAASDCFDLYLSEYKKNRERE